MKDILKQERGVSLISLAAAIIIIGIITTMLLYSVGDTKDISNLANLYSDIDNLSTKVGNYYATYGKIPAFEKSGLDTVIEEKWGTSAEPESDSPIGENDTGKFLVIDLNAIENLTLNYGRDFETVKGDTAFTNEYTDLYIINENSHNVFYLKGLVVGEHTYYTNRDKDVAKVDLRYVDGIKIYDGCTYKSGDKRSGIVIVKDDNNKEYKWANVEDGVYNVRQDDTAIKYTYGEESEKTINLESDKNDEFLSSVNEYGGFYLSESGDNAVLYFTVTDKWSIAYDSTSMYKDKNGDTAYIPQGFQVSKLSTMNTINTGLVIRNATTLDEYVWIDVPDDVLKDAHTLDEIENTLKDYTSEYSDKDYEDSWYDGCGIESKDKYNELKNKMYQSIKDNGGFYIGRYEAGNNGDNTLVVQRDKNPYHSVTVSQSQILAYSTNDNKYTTSLMFGIQWDLVCKFIEETGAKSYDEITKNSKDWGQYRNSEFTITSENANLTKGTRHESGDNYWCTTGASNQNKVLNIYDFAGNMWEWTLEHTLNQGTKVCTARGGDYSRISGTNGSASYRYYNETTFINHGIAFRVTLYK